MGKEAHERDREVALMCFSYSRAGFAPERSREMKKLSHAKAGRYTVKWIFTEPDLKQLLSDIRVEVGREITVISNSFGNILIRSEAGSFVLDAEAAAGVTI